MPDSIGSYDVGGKTYLVTANEGDGRDYTGFADEARVGDLTLDTSVFTDPALQDDANLGRIKASAVAFDGSTPTTYDEIFTFGARSFSIWEADTGAQVWDSDDAFEQITASLYPDYFNSDNDSFDSRSDDKGPEPETLVLGAIDDNILAFIGLERMGGIMVYDITYPMSPAFLTYLLNRDFTVAADTVGAGDLGPEGMYFLTPDQSPTGNYGPIVANEVSGSTTDCDISVPVPAPLALLAAGLVPLLPAPALHVQDSVIFSDYPALIAVPRPPATHGRTRCHRAQSGRRRTAGAEFFRSSAPRACSGRCSRSR